MDDSRFQVHIVYAVGLFHGWQQQSPALALSTAYGTKLNPSWISKYYNQRQLQTYNPDLFLKINK